MFDVALMRPYASSASAILTAGLAAALLEAGALYSVAEQPQSSAVFPASTEMVHVAVAVQDGRDAPVLDLHREDFTVRENGRIQQLLVCARTSDPTTDANLDLNVALLLDVSGSMAEPVKLSRLAAMTFLDTMPRSQHSLVVLFRDEVRGFWYDPHEREGALQLIDETPPSGGTALYDAIKVGLETLRPTGTRQVVVVVTDGHDNGSETTGKMLVELVARSSATVYPVLLVGVDARRGVLAQLARISGGRLFEITKAANIPSAYDSIRADLLSQYVLGFAPSDSAADGGYRTLEVSVRRPKVKLRYRKSYVRSIAP